MILTPPTKAKAELAAYKVQPHMMDTFLGSKLVLTSEVHSIATESNQSYIVHYV